ncbi:hypothetical protein [Pseudactinotalea terrae]|uniref:hypothetical protein n=1 Tax=Pseudactinotalea terrae TaxID=1743262 RepID=UPI0012E297D8|nr:hypothetical protein [Pseudactinotalea terrae]
MTTTPTPPDPAPDRVPGPTPTPPAAPEVVAAPVEPAAAAAPTARSGVPRWLLITIIVVVLVAAGVIAAVALTGGGDEEEPAASELPAADVTTIVGGPVTLVAQAQWDLDTNGYIYLGARCVFPNPARTFENGVGISVFCPFIFTPDTVVLEGRDIIVVPGAAGTPATLTIAEGAQALDGPAGCPAVGTQVQLPPAGTPPGPPVACLQSTDGARFAVFVTAVDDGRPTIAVVRVS